MEATINRIVLFIGAFIVLALPAVAFVAGYQHLRGTIMTEAEINGRLVTAIINESPENWRFQHDKLADLLSRRPSDATPEIRRIVDAARN